MEVLELLGVRKALGGREVLKGITLSVYKGDVFGYLGPNGAGKTTTIRIILGLLRQDAGTVRLFGREADEATRARVGFVLESDGLFDGMTARENLLLYARIYGADRRRIGELLELVGLSERGRERVGSFSRGMRQRLALARALVHDPDILVLDEPTAGLDPSGQIGFRELIGELAGTGKTVFLSSHNLDEVQKVCNRVALIHRGEIRLAGELPELERRMARGGYVVELPREPDGALLQRVREAFGSGEVEVRGREVLLPESCAQSPSDLLRRLGDLGLEVEGVRRHRPDLEEIYTEILKEAEG